MIRDLTPALLIVVLIVGSILAVGWIAWNVWGECRAFGHSVLYCLRMIGR